MIRLFISVLLLVGLASCGGERREARATFNNGVSALAKGELEQAEKLLLEARDKAGMDPDLQFRAAYNLGLVYAAQSEKAKGGEEPDLEKALSLAQTAAMWFGDASHQHEDDKDTTTNLAIVRARIQAISDELRKGEGSLEARLDALIGEQRAVLDDARDAWAAIKETGGSDPLAQQAAMANLADRERGIVAEAGTLTDLAADEIDAIGKKAEDQRSQEEKSRVVQLKNVDLLLLDARGRISEARRKLQDLAAEDGVARAEAALIALKRAREQLLDPITRLRGLAQDELALLQETAYAGGSTGALLDAKHEPKAPDQLPGWMAPDKLAERQSGLRDRLEEVRAGLQAFIESPQAAIDPRAGVVDPEAGKQVKLIERIKVALPSVADASAAMERARAALGEKKLTAGIEEERAVLVALSKAIEQFANLKQTIELAHNDQQALIKLLGEEGAQLPTADRAKETRDALARNVARMPRLKELLAEEVTALAQKKQQLDQPPPTQPGAPAQPPPDPKQIEAAKQELAQQEQMLAQAEVLRGQAETALAALEKAIAANQDPLTPAKDGGTKIVELRKLFFSVIEHLQQLVIDQGETRDQSSVLNNEDQFAREAKLPGLVGRQDGHGEMAKAIAEALAAQADAAGKQQGQPPQPGAPDAKALAGAANEVRLAHGEMLDASGTLTKARDTKTSSERLDPALDSQAKAIEHLKAALALLQPPQNGKDKKQQQQQDQSDADQQQQQKPQQQSGGAGQRARDEDAKRQREKRRPGSDPAEKDW
ncbi:MAG: hypothetical protein SFX73_12080 [Kofleriaceae bacterium]|nr:hypothetical protein [Kofleriaceae bacterium]